MGTASEVWKPSAPQSTSSLSASRSAGCSFPNRLGQPSASIIYAGTSLRRPGEASSMASDSQPSGTPSTDTGGAF